MCLVVFVPLGLYNYMKLQTGSVEIKGAPCAKMWKKHFHKENIKFEKGSILISHRFCLIHNVFLFSFYVTTTIIGCNKI
jgi:hypothetical protein